MFRVLTPEQARDHELFHQAAATRDPTRWAELREQMTSEGKAILDRLALLRQGIDRQGVNGA